MNPHIEVQLRSINSNLNYNDPNYVDDDASLFHVVVADNKLKLLLTVEWQDPLLHPREFQVVRLDHLYLDGQDKDRVYPQGTAPWPGQLSADSSIVQDLFADQLSPYGIRLDRVVVHNHTNYESVNFAFTDPAKMNDLYDRINQAGVKAKYSPGSLA